MKICLSEPMAQMLEAEIAALLPNAELVRLRPDGSFVGDPTGAEVFCFSVDLSTQQESLHQALTVLQQPGLAWVQAPGAGVELPMWTEVMDRGVRLTSAAGVHAEPVAQYVVTQILHWHRQVEEHRLQQVERKWQPIFSDDLTSKTVGIVGLGGIGLSVARIAKALGMTVLGLRRSPGDAEHVDQMFGTQGLGQLLADSHYVVLALPLTQATENLIGAAEFDAMRSDAVLVNVARGAVVDHAALETALVTGAIAGASLDVTEPEPLPTESPLWSLPNCVITAHDAGYSPLAGERLSLLFMENLRAYVDGTTLRNEVQPQGQ